MRDPSEPPGSANIGMPLEMEASTGIEPVCTDLQAVHGC